MKTNFHLLIRGLIPCLVLTCSLELNGQDIQPTDIKKMTINNVAGFAALNVSRRVDGVAHLRWNSDQENRLVTYLIEHSIDGIHFQTISVLEKEKNQNSFDFLHKTIAKGMNYYRLRVLTGDGAPYYSAIQKLFCSRVKQVLRIFPTIAIGTANLILDADDGEEMQVKIFDLTGKAVCENVVQFHSQMARLDVQDLDRGLYTVVVKKENGQQLRSKLLVAY